MSESRKKDNLTIALAGNPNSGKTTLFNALTGLSQKVANYAGVTIERKEGQWKTSDGTHLLIDLPGLYSINASSPDEIVARDVLAGEISDLGIPDCVILVADSTNLERNLFLATQLQEFQIPLVIALTMNDNADRQGLVVDENILATGLGNPVVKINATSGSGLLELGKEVRTTVEKGLHTIAPKWRDVIDDSGNETGNRNDIFQRYAFIERVVGAATSVRAGKSEKSSVVRSEKIDRILTHKVFGPLVLLGVLLVVFQMVFAWASLPMELLDSGFGFLGDAARSSLGDGVLTDLLVDGIIAGVGGVLVFLPQILILFLFISILEDSGYMARAAFMSDRLMGGIGLHGKAFLPLISSFACAIPGIMATRTIENPRDRIATILIAPFMSCSARLPVYTLMIAAFFSDRTLWGFISLGAVLMIAMYLLGVVFAVLVAFILKKTVLKAPTPPLLLELPPYRLPNIRTVLQNMFSKASQFVRNAGTVILAISIVLWALAYFPVPEMGTDQASGAQTESVAPEKGRLEKSYAGHLGRLIEPVIEPLGFDWKIGVSLIASFAAREVFVSTMSIIYGMNGEEAGEIEGEGKIADAIRDAERPDGSPAWTPLTAITLMVFFVLAMQCMSTVAVVKKETNSWRWPVFMTVYMTGLAWFAAFATFQIGSLMGF
jgi:ferrous iron transport protein B